MEDALARINRWNKSVPRVELDQRARDARVRLVQIERLIVPRASGAGFLAKPVWPAARFSRRRQPARRWPGPHVAERSAPWLFPRIGVLLDRRQHELSGLTHQRWY